MKTSIKVLAWFEAVIGGLAILGSLGGGDGYGLVGGLLFLVCGWLTLVYITSEK